MPGRDAAGVWRLRTVFRDGKDPNDACAEPLFAECTTGPVEPGAVRIEYAQAEFELEVPTQEVPVCKTPEGEPVMGWGETE